MNRSVAQPDFGVHEPLAYEVGLRESVAPYRVVSLDVFDTAVCRRGFLRPTDVFTTVWERAGLDSTSRHFSFAEERVRAEREARFRATGKGLEDVTLSEIYNALWQRLWAQQRIRMSRDDQAALVRSELDAELECLVAKPEMLTLFKLWRGDGKRIVFTSDTYFERSFVAQVLERTGYRGYEKLYVSSELRRSKHSGSLYDWLLADLRVPASEVIHIGDNRISDLSRSAERGIAATNAVSPAAMYSAWAEIKSNEHCEGDSGNFLRFIAETLFADGAQRDESLSTPEKIGIGCLAPLLFGLATWLYRRTEETGRDALFFCSRDGLIMKRVFDMLQDRFGKRAESHYLHISRLVVNRARAAIDSADLRELFIQNWSVITPRQALARWRLDARDFAKTITAAGFRSADEELSIGQTVSEARLAALFESCRPAIAEANRKEGDLLMAYLRQVGFLDARTPGLVDIGWHGSLQSGVLSVAPQTAERLTGFYLGLFQDPQAREADREGYLFSADHGPLARAVRKSPSLVELLHTAGHGSVSGYRRSARLITPVLEEGVEELVGQFRTVIEPAQESAVAVIAQFLKGVGFSKPTGLAPNVALASMRRLLTHPTPEEWRLLRVLRIATNFGTPTKLTQLGERNPQTGYTLWDLG
jgi:FMN phosphatase YigB (HAD superfamily)